MDQTQLYQHHRIPLILHITASTELSLNRSQTALEASYWLTMNFSKLCVKS